MIFKKNKNKTTNGGADRKWVRKYSVIYAGINKKNVIIFELKYN